MKIVQTKNQKNSLLEIIKFAFALMVLIGHKLTPIPVFQHNWGGYWFGSAGIAVEFFFCVAGWFMLKSISKAIKENKHLGLWRSWWKFFVKKITPYLVPCLMPGLLVNIVVTFYDGWIPNFLLWMTYFVHEMMLVMALYYIIFYKIEDEHKRLLANIILLIIGTIARYSLRTIEVLNIASFQQILPFWRGLCFMSLGGICSKIPTLNLKEYWKWLLCILSVLLCLTFVTLPIKDIYKECIYFITYPLMIFFCINVRFSFKPFDYLGSLSKGLYLWQMVPWMFNVIGKYYSLAFFMNKWFLLTLAFILPIVEDCVRRIIRYKKMKNFDPKAEEIKLEDKSKKILNFYTNKKIYISFLLISILLLASGAGYAMYGLWVGNFKNFDWFIKNGRITFNFAGIITLIFLSPIFILLTVNWKIQNSYIEKGKSKNRLLVE